jgi:hypothetical protein
MQATREKRAAEGLKRLELWAHPSDHPAIKGYAAKLAKSRAAAQKRAKKAQGESNE